MNINDLPDALIGQQIFSKLPLAATLRLHHVCRKWATVQQSLLSTVTRVRIIVGEEWQREDNIFTIPKLHHLKSGPPSSLTEQQLTPPPLPVDSFPTTTESTLHFEWLNMACARQLARQLPAIAELAIAYQWVTPVKLFGERARPADCLNLVTFTHPQGVLIKAWCGRLRKLALTGCFSAYIFREPDGTICEVDADKGALTIFWLINRCRQLKHLYLEIHSGEGFPLTPDNPPPVNYSFLGRRLETLHFYMLELNSTVVPALLQYCCSSAHLRSVSLGVYDLELFKKLLFEKKRNQNKTAAEIEQLYGKIGQLLLPFPLNPKAQPDEWRFLTSYFTGLTTLSLVIEDVPSLATMMQALSLRQTSLLSLEIHLLIRTAELLNLDHGLGEEDEHLTSAEQHPLKSVRFLTVVFDCIGGPDWQACRRLAWERLFPEVELLTLVGLLLREAAYQRQQRFYQPDDSIDNLEDYPNPNFFDARESIDFYSAEAVEVTHCQRSYLRAWKRCPKLRLAFTDHRKHWNMVKKETTAKKKTTNFFK